MLLNSLGSDTVGSTISSCSVISPSIPYMPLNSLDSIALLLNGSISIYIKTVYVDMYSYIQIHEQNNMYMCIYTHIYVFVCIYIYTYKYAYIYRDREINMYRH